MRRKKRGLDLSEIVKIIEERDSIVLDLSNLKLGGRSLARSQLRLGRRLEKFDR